MATIAYGVDSPQGQFHSMSITRRDVGEKDVALEVIYCGICHSDIHTARNEWGLTQYPVIPGHEILGRVTSVGSKVTKFKVGDLAGVGCYVDSCRECSNCKEDVETFCEKGASFTYNSFEQDKKTPTYGGYSTKIVVDQHFAISIPNTFSKLEGIAPLFCAGSTTWAPLNRHKDRVAPGKKVGIVGLGGLGHMGVKFAVAMGAEVTVFSTSPNKEQDAKKLGANHFVVTKDAEAMKSVANSLDLILDTVSAKHDLALFLGALKTYGVLAVVGAPPEPLELATISVIWGNKTIYGSGVGGIKETQEMVDFCAKHNIVSEVEVIGIDKIAEAYERIVKADVKYRFVIDIESLKHSS